MNEPLAVSNPETEQAEHKSPDPIKREFQKIQKIKKEYPDTKLDNQQNYLIPYGANEHFPTNLRFSDKVPQLVASVIQTALNERPSSLLAQHLSPLHTPLENQINAVVYEINTDRETLEIMQNQDQKNHDLINFYQQKIEDNSQTLERLQAEYEAQAAELRSKRTSEINTLLLNWLGINQPQDEEAALEIFTKLNKAQKTSEEFLYFSDILDKAKQFLTILAPSLQSLLTISGDETLLSKRVFPDGMEPPPEPEGSDEPLDLATLDRKGLKQQLLLMQLENENRLFFNSNLTTEGITFLEVNPLDSLKKNKGHFTRLIIMAHELMHTVTQKLLYAESQKLPADKQMHSASIFKMITEGVSLAFELELVELLLKQKSLSPSSRAELLIYKSSRYEYLKESAKSWKPGVKKLFRGNESPKPSDQGSLAYYEGITIAKILRRNGWQLNDLAFFLHQLQNILIQEVGTSNIDDLRKIPLEKNDSGWFSRLSPTKYIRVKKRLTQLKPPTAA